MTTHPIQSASAVDTRSAAGSSSDAPPNHPNAQPIDKHALEAATQTIRRELAQRVVPGTCSQAAALDEVLALVFGEHRSAAERLRFLAFAAPFARRLVLQRTAKELRVLDHDIAVAHVRELFHWCDAFDPLGARMLDLHYFAGVSVKQTALALEIHPTAVIRGLRFAKVWLGLKLGMLELISLGPRPVDSPSGRDGGETGGSSRRARFPGCERLEDFKMKKASTNGPTVTNQQLDELIARDEAAQGLWERSFAMKYHALLELRARRNNSASDQLTSPKGALTDSQLDFLIQIGRRNLQEDPDSADYHQQTLAALTELRALRR